MYVILLFAAGAIAAGVGLARMGTAGETISPLALTVTSTVPSATPTLGAGSVPSPSAAPSPSPTPYPAPLAQEIVQRYWNFISRGEIVRAYDLLSAGAKLVTTRQQFVLTIGHLVDATNGLTAVAGPAQVSGDSAIVPVTLRFTNSTGTTRNSQQLMWEGATWRIDEAVTPTATPTPGG